MSWHGKFVWYELMARDLAAAGDFYGSVLGWDVVDAGMPGGGYSMFTKDGTNQGGLMSVMDGGPPPSWIGYVAVDDCDATAAEAERTGATIHRAPFSIPGVGKVAILGDPQGALIAIIQPTPPEDNSGGSPPHAAWHDLRSTDGAAAWGFYAPLFRWEERGTMHMGPGGLYRIFGAPGAPDMGGVMSATQPPVPAWIFYLPVPTVEGALERVRVAGGSVRQEPHQVPGGAWVAACADPEGAHFSVFSQER